MGYYIYFVFDDNTVSSYEDVVARFCRAGAVVFDYRNEEMPEDLRKKLQNYVKLLYSEFPYFITVFKNESMTSSPLKK